MNILDPLGDPLDGVTFVEASAGTGKTYAIEMFYLRLVAGDDLSPEQIAVVTYTNAAAAELRQRIRDRLRAALDFARNVARGDGAVEGAQPWQAYLAALPDSGVVTGRLVRALYDFDRAAVSTIHGFCQRTLVEHAFHSGSSFALEVIVDQTSLVDEVVRDFVAAEIGEVPRPVLEAVWKRDALGMLARFASRCAAQPDLRLVPEARPWAAALADWQAAFDRTAELWREDSDAIVALRCESAALKSRSRMKEEKLRERVAAVLSPATLFSSDRGKVLEMLSSSGLLARTAPGCEPPQHAFFDCCEVLAQVEPALLNASRSSIFHGLAEFARREIPARKEAAGVAYFDDLLLDLRRALLQQPAGGLSAALASRFKVGLIDEFQDTDPVQYEIFERIFAAHGRPMVLIGDAKQSIYAFRGGDIHTYIGARSAATRISTLDANRRSSDRVVRAINTLFARQGAFVLDAIDFQPARAVADAAELEGGDGGVTLLRCRLPARQSEAAIAAGVASHIVEVISGAARIGDRAVRPADCAVLCRTNAEAVKIQEELRRRAVASVLQGDRSVFESAEAETVRRLLQTLADPADYAALRAALCTDLCGVGGDELIELVDDEAGWQMWIDRARVWRRRWDEHGFMSAFRAVLDECRTGPRLLLRDGGERSLTNFLHLGELLQVASRRMRGGPQRLLDWLVLMCGDVAARGAMAAEDAQVRLESDADAVVLTTIHKSKGLEYPIVYLPYLSNAWRLRGDDAKLPRYHDEAAGRSIFVGAPIDEGVTEAATLQGLGEEMRLAYVGLTRAQNACYVVMTEDASVERSPIGRLVGDDVEAVAAESDGAIAIEEMRTSTTTAPRADRGRRVEEPPPAPAITGGWRVSSFSGLTRDADHLEANQEEGFDRDEVGEAAVGAETRGHDAGERIALAEMSAGTRVGLMIHSVFEDLDFQLRDSAEIEALVRDKVEAFRCANQSAAALARALEEIVRAPLPGGELALADVAPARRLDELEFVLPVQAPGGCRLTPQRLADVLDSHAAPAPDPTYAERVRELGFPAFAGFLRGFVDLVFEHRGRWYVVDYKSNHLGVRWQDYGPERLLEPMRRHDYFLQYLLYTVAVDRYLATRLRDYSYAESFGGVYYLFVRGMAATVPGNGVFYDRPAPELVADLGRLFGAPA